VKIGHLRVPGGQHVVELFEYALKQGTKSRALRPPNTGTSHLC